MPDDQLSPLEAINQKFGLGGALTTAEPTPVAPAPAGAEPSPLELINRRFGLSQADLPGAGTVTEPSAQAAPAPTEIPSALETIGKKYGIETPPPGQLPQAIAPTKAGTVERLGRHFVGGALGTAEGIGGAVQWITGGAMGKDFSDYMGSLRKDVTPEGEPSFVEQLASGAGSMATYFIPGFGVARGLGLVARIAPKAAQWLGAGAMAVTEAATEAGQVYRNELEKGKNADIASSAASWTFWLNLPVLTVTDKLAFFGNQGKALSRALRGMVTEGSQESLQEVISTWSQEEQQNLKNILTSGAIGAILGGGFGAVARPLKQPPQPTIEPTIEPTAEPAPEPFDVEAIYKGRERAIESLQPPPSVPGPFTGIAAGKRRAEQVLAEQPPAGIEGGRDRALAALGIKPPTPMGITGAEVAERATIKPETPALTQEAEVKVGLTQPEVRERKLTFREFLDSKGINPNVGNEASQFYDQKRHKELLAEWKSQSGLPPPELTTPTPMGVTGGDVAEMATKEVLPVPEAKGATEAAPQPEGPPPVETRIEPIIPEEAPPVKGEMPTEDAEARAEFTKKFGTAGKVGMPQGVVTAKPKGLERAVAYGDIARIIKSHGGIDPKSASIRGFEPGDRQTLGRLVLKTGGFAPDVLFTEVKSMYPDYFGHFEDAEDMMRSLVDGRAKRILNKEVAQSDAEAYDEIAAREAEKYGLTPEEFEKIKVDAQREFEAEETGEGGRGDEFFTFAAEPEVGPTKYRLKGRTEAAFGLRPQEKPTSRIETRLKELKAEYPEIDRDQASIVLRTFPDAANDQVANMVADPEMFRQMVESTKTAAGQVTKGGEVQPALPGMGRSDTLFRAGTLPAALTGGLYGPEKGYPGEIPGRKLRLLATPEEGGRFLDGLRKWEETNLEPGSENQWGETKYSERLAQSPIIRKVHNRLDTMGLDVRVVPVEDSPVAGAMITAPNGQRYMILDARYGEITIKELSEHEIFHERKRIGDPAAQALLDSIDIESPAFKDYLKAFNHIYTEAGWNPLDAATMAEEIAADYAAGIKEIKLADRTIKLSEAFKAGTDVPQLFTRYLMWKPGKAPPVEKGLPEGIAPPKYRIRPADTESRLQAYQDKMVAPEKGKSGWQNFKDRVFLQGDTKQEAADTLHGWYDELVDRYAPLERAEARAVKAGGILPAGEAPTYTLSFWRGQEGWTAQAVMKNGVYHETIEGGRFTGDNQKVGESLTKRLDPIRQLAEKRGEKPEAIMNDLYNRFMVAQRDLELAGETGVREAGEIKGVNPDESRAVLRDLQQVYGADYGVLETVAGRLENNGNFTPGSIREWADQAILQRLEQAGLLSPELRQEIKGKNQYYLPFKRLMDEVDSYVETYARALGVKGKVIQQIKGSERQILDPLQMLMDLAAKANYAYARNRVLDSLAKLGQFDPEIREVKPKLVPSGIDKKNIWSPLGRSGWAMKAEQPEIKKGWAWSQLPPEEGCVPYYRDGKPRWLKLPADMFKATQNMMPEDIGLLLSWAKKPADLLRTGAVRTPEFALVTNPLRDMAQAWVFSRFGFSPLKWFRDLGLLISKDPATLELRNQAEAGGGFMATLAQSMLEPEHITADDITGKKKGMWYAVHPVQAMTHVSAYLENMTRFSIYKQAREKGLSHAEAIFEMRRTTLDFRRTGGHPVVRYLNMIIPFFNASIQGTDKLASELAGPNRNAVLRRLALMTAGTIGLWLLAHQDDRYKELENWERNYFWHIPLGGKNGPMIRLPKPFEAGILFGSVPERILDQLLDKNVGGVKSALGAAWKALTPEFIPAFARGIIEGGTNYNWFLERPIEDVSLQSLPVELRSKPWTTELAKAVSKYVGPAASPVMELSPVKVEHLIRTMSGGLGANYFLPGIDVALRKAGILEDIPQPEQDTIQKIWGVRAFFTKPPVGYRAKTVSDFFENSQQVLQADQGWKNLWNTGTMDKLDKFLANNPEAMFARVARKQMAEMGKVKKERNAIHLSRTLTPEQKKAKLDALDEKIVQLAKVGQALMDPEVARAIKMPSRFKRDELGIRKSMDLDGYYKMTVESVGDAYDTIQKDLPRITRMDEAQRQRYLIKIIRQAREEYQPILKKPEDVMKPYRFANLLDKPTRLERAKWQAMMGFRKIPPGMATGYRMKEPEEEER